jgi:transcription elongation GreA/GreB family factor
MNKQELVRRIIDLLSREAENLKEAAKTAHADATNEESKAENKYDTRGLEASYLAEAQAKMAVSVRENVAAYKTISLQEFTNKSRIALTAFIELESADGRRSFYFLGPKGGGTEIEYDKMKVLLITPSSPLGAKLIGCEVGDCIIMQASGIKKEYEVISIS